MRKILKGAICILLAILFFIPCNIANEGNDKMEVYVIVDKLLEKSTPVPASTLQENLAPNPSFEEGDEMPTGWIYDNMDEESVIFNWDSEYAHSGEKSVGIKNIVWKDKYPDYAYRDYMWYTADFIPVEPLNYTYLYSIWYKYIGQRPGNIWDQYGAYGIMLYDNDKDYLNGLLLLPRFSTAWSYSEWNFLSLDHFDKETLRKTKFVRLELVHGFGMDAEVDPSLEIRFDDVFFGPFENHPPTAPIIDGPTQGKTGIEYKYTFVSMDSEGNRIHYYVEWGDGTNDTYYGGESGKKITISHKWNERGYYTIRSYAFDDWDAKSDWSTLEVNMPKNNDLFSWLEKLLIRILPGVFAFPLTSSLDNKNIEKRCQDEDLLKNSLQRDGGSFIYQMKKLGKKSDLKAENHLVSLVYRGFHTS